MSAKNIIVSILNELKELHHVTRDYLAKKYNISVRTVQRNISILRKNGYIIITDKINHFYIYSKKNK
jgi:DeoR/GlpR family transcriptional regulator of sugar metabolism